ncbi:MAG: ShlB/FhaC/HecB family hemolysin secretion/activation protein [Pseudomonadales bacterium]
MNHIQSYSGGILVCFLVASHSVAQTPSTEPQFDSSFGDNISRGFSDSEPGFGDDLNESTEEATEQLLPPLPTEEGPDRIVESMQFDKETPIKNVIVLGNSALPANKIAAVAAPFENRTLKPESIYELRQRLSLLYYKHGYVNSGVVIPTQDLADGNLTLQVIEGELSSVDLEGNRRLSDAYIEERLRRNITTPLNLDELQDSLRQLELNPLIGRVNGQLLPGLNEGSARLRLKVTEAKPYRATLSLNNHRSPSVGAERAVLSLEHMNLTGHGDLLQLSGSISDGLRDGYIGYTLPLTASDTTLALNYQRGSSEVVERPFKELDIKSDTEGWAASINHPFINRLNRNFSVRLGVSHSSSETELLGFPFSFSLGAREGTSASSSVSVGVEWTERRGNQVLALRSTVRHGLDAFDSTIIPDGQNTVDLTTNAEIPESKFTAITTQLQFAKRFSYRNTQMVFSTVWQQAFDPLLSVEKFAVGGAFSVRGFRENQVVRDNGLAASLEFRIPLFIDENGFDKWKVTLIPFIDYGRSWDEDSELSTSKAVDISSAGLGLAWNPHRSVAFNLFYAEPIEDGNFSPPGEQDLQDDGLHFSLRFSWPFN